LLWNRWFRKIRKKIKNMGYNMKRGAAPKFKELGSSPTLDTELPDLSGTTDEPGTEVDLTKKPVGPKADIKTDPDYEVGGVTLDPGYEDPIKIQKDQREGVVPGSQTFAKADPPAPGFKSMDVGSYIKGKQLREEEE
jgi:hypothetical protein